MAVNLAKGTWVAIVTSTESVSSSYKIGFTGSNQAAMQNEIENGVTFSNMEISSRYESAI